MTMLNTKYLKKLLDAGVIADIKEFGKPAFMYNYHYDLKGINALDSEDLWNQEHASLLKQKPGLVTTQVKREIKIGIKKWECILWIIQLGELQNKQVACQPQVAFGQSEDEKEFLEMITIPDPLAMSIGYVVSGYCYLQLIKPIR